jgi:alkaline phosphatase D
VTSPKTITKIAFGSCYNGKGNTPIAVLDVAMKQNPDLFIFLGDNIYGDTNNMEVLEKKYAVLGANPSFQNVVKNTQVLATWDDHDYGVNDGGNDYPKRVESEKYFSISSMNQRILPDASVRAFIVLTASEKKEKSFRLSC